MANTAKRFQNEEKKNISQKISDILIKYRMFIIGFVVALIIAAIGCGIYFSISGRIHGKGFAELDYLTVSLTDARGALSGDELIAKESEILASAETLAGKNKGNAVGVRAQMFIAELYFARTDWENARTAWLAASESKPKIYTAPLGFYNAAVCSEELGDNDAALTYYEKAAASEDFSLKPRALFNMGRIEDQRGNYQKAADKYESLAAKYPSDAWASLAKSRILVLQTEGKLTDIGLN